MKLKQSPKGRSDYTIFSVRISQFPETKPNTNKRKANSGPTFNAFQLHKNFLLNPVKEFLLSEEGLESCESSQS